MWTVEMNITDVVLLIGICVMFGHVGSVLLMREIKNLKQEQLPMEIVAAIGLITLVLWVCCWLVWMGSHMG